MNQLKFPIGVNEARPVGVEQPAFSSSETLLSENSGATVGAVDDHSALSFDDSGLGRIVKAWPTLAQCDRETILGIIDRSTP